MDRDALEQLVEEAMDNISDMDTRLSDYARVAVEALGWRKIDDEKPDDGDLVIMSDGEARWMGMGISDGWRRWTDTKDRVATLWHPVQDLPALGGQ